LDIIRLDGRWAQMGSSTAVVYLDDLSVASVDLRKYRVAKDYRSMAVWYVEKYCGAVFSDAEIRNIRWGPEQERNPELKTYVTVFAEYVRKA
jgi:hypothetical protein